MQNFYFTYGSEGYPYKGGWTKIRCESLKIAIKVFQIYHPDKEVGLLNCADYYPEEWFRKTKMFENGNLGEYCHEFIDLYRSVITEENNEE